MFLSFREGNFMDRDINKVIFDNDFLGFGTIEEAKNAILNHFDWKNRWEINNLQDLEIIENWKKNIGK